jgi:hypothetical protein
MFSEFEFVYSLIINHAFYFFILANNIKFSILLSLKRFKEINCKDLHFMNKLFWVYYNYKFLTKIKDTIVERAVLFCLE